MRYEKRQTSQKWPVSSSIHANAEHQKKSAKQGVSTLLEYDSQENEHQVSIR